MPAQSTCIARRPLQLSHIAHQGKHRPSCNTAHGYDFSRKSSGSRQCFGRSQHLRAAARPRECRPRPRWSSPPRIQRVAPLTPLTVFATLQPRFTPTLAESVAHRRRLAPFTVNFEFGDVDKFASRTQHLRFSASQAREVELGQLFDSRTGLDGGTSDACGEPRRQNHRIDCGVDRPRARSPCW